MPVVLLSIFPDKTGVLLQKFVYVSDGLMGYRAEAAFIASLPDWLSPQFRPNNVS